MASAAGILARVPRAGLAVLGTAAAVAAAGIHGLGAAGSSAPRALIVDAAAVALIGGTAVLATGRRESHWAAWTPWVISGALLSAAIAGVSTIAPWLLVAVLTFGWAGVLATRRRRRRVLGPLAGVAGGAVLNFAFLAVFMTGAPMRADPAEFQSLDLRVHALLEGIPLHDVWVFHLRGGGEGRTLEDLMEVLRSNRPRRPNPIVAGLVMLRWTLGWIFGWDEKESAEAPASYVHRLSEEDKSRTLEPPGKDGGVFHVVYAFERESLLELMNNTVHAFAAMALVPAGDGYTLYWAFYIKRTSWFTPVYMAAIDPFRRIFIYPAAVRRIEEAWAARWEGGEIEGGEGSEGVSESGP